MVAVRVRILLLAVVLLLPVTYAAAQDDPEGIHENLVHFIDETFNQGNLDIVDEMFAEDYVAHPSGNDREGFKEHVRSLRAAFPDMAARIDLVVVEDDMAAFHWSTDGTFTSEYVTPQGTFPPTGNPVHIELNIFIRYDEDGKVAEEWDYLDNLGLLTQLGVFPAPEGAGAPMMEEMPMMGDGDPEANAATLSSIYDALNAHDMDAAAELNSPDYVHHQPAGTFDLAGWKAFLTGIMAAMPDVTFTPETMIAEGNLVATRLAAHGTFTGSMMMPDGSALPGNNAEIDVPLSLIYVIGEDGKPLETWENFDQLAFLIQIGAISMDSGG